MQKINMGADILPIYRNQIGASGKKRPMWSITIKTKAKIFKLNVVIFTSLDIYSFNHNIDSRYTQLIQIPPTGQLLILFCRLPVRRWNTNKLHYFHEVTRSCNTFPLLRLHFYSENKNLLYIIIFFHFFLALFSSSAII